MQIIVYSAITHLGALVTGIQAIDVFILLSQHVYILDTCTKASGSQAHKEKWSVPLDVNGNTGAGIRTQDLPRVGRTP